MSDKAVCENCAQQWRYQRLNPIKDIFQRVAPGVPMPAGECPGCGALCYFKEETGAWDDPYAVAHRQHDFGSLGLFFFSSREKALRYAACIIAEELNISGDDAEPIIQAINDCRYDDALEMWREIDGNLDLIDIEPIKFDLFDSDAPVICEGDSDAS